MIHKPGKTNRAPNDTSQIIDHKLDKSEGNSNITVLIPQHFCITSLKTGQATLANDTKIIKRIKQCSKHNEEVRKALATIQKLGPLRPQNNFEDWN